MIIKIINVLIIFLFLHSPAFAIDNPHVEEILITESRTYYKTKQTWQNVYHNLTKNDKTIRGATFIAPIKGNGYNDPKHKNGARNTIIFVPKDTRFDGEPIDVIFYFHGLGGFKERDFNTRVLRHTKHFKESGKNFIIVIPEMPWSKNTSTPRKRQGRVFTKKHQFSTFVSGVVRTVITLFDPSPIRRNKCVVHNICQFDFGETVLLGHSAGGSALMSISKSGGLNWLYEKKNPFSIKIIFSDAGYGHWTEITWRNFKPKGIRDLVGVEFILLTRKWDKPYRNTKRFLKRFKNIPANIQHKVFNRKFTHAGIGDISFRWVYYLKESGCGEGERFERAIK